MCLQVSISLAFNVICSAESVSLILLRRTEWKFSTGYSSSVKIVAQGFIPYRGIFLPMMECGQGNQQCFIVVASSEHNKHDPTYQQ